MSGGEGPRLLTVGTINNGSTLIQVDVTYLSPAVAVKVLLSTPYAMLCPVAWPSRPGQTGCDAGDLSFPKTIASGTTVAFLAPEANAIVAAGGGSFA